MSDDKKKVVYQGEVGLDGLQAYLKELQAGLKAGQIWVQSGNEIVGLHPSAQVSLSVEAKRKKGRESLTLEVEWEPSAEQEPEAGGSLVISAKEPDPVIVEEAD